jgi:hypothetical protein
MRVSLLLLQGILPMPETPTLSRISTSRVLHFSRSLREVGLFADTNPAAGQPQN